MTGHDVTFDVVRELTAHVVYMRECNRLLSLIAASCHQLGKHMEQNEGHDREARKFLAQTYDFASKHASRTADWLASHEAQLAEYMTLLDEEPRT